MTGSAAVRLALAASLVAAGPTRAAPAPKPRPAATTAKPGSAARAALPSSAPWTDHVRRFTGESAKVRENAIAELRKRPNLKAELRKAIGTPDHFLALDAISVLGMRTLFQELLFFSEKDRTGYSYHVLNSLMKPGEEAEIGAVYLVRLDRPGVSAASKMAILDSLARMNVAVGGERLERMLRHETPEVRAAAIAYLRAELRLRRDPAHRELLRVALADAAFQNRLQALFLVSELKSDDPFFGGLLAGCANDPVAQVRTFCNELRAAKAPPPGSAPGGGT